MTDVQNQPTITYSTPHTATRESITSHLRAWGPIDTVVVHVLYPGKTTSEPEIDYLLKRFNEQDALDRSDGGDLYWILAHDGAKVVGGIRILLWPNAALGEKRTYRTDYFRDDFAFHNYAEFIVPAYMEIRYSVAVGPHATIELLWVEEEYRRHGIGNKLVEDAMRIVDDAGLVSYVEPSPIGEKMYRRNGFVEQVALDKIIIPERFRGDSNGREEIMVKVLRRAAKRAISD